MSEHTFEALVIQGTKLIPLPELGEGKAIGITEPFLCTHPSSGKAATKSSLVDSNGENIFVCSVTGEHGGAPRDIWTVLATKLGWIRKKPRMGVLQDTIEVPTDVKLRITVEVVNQPDS